MYKRCFLGEEIHAYRKDEEEMSVVDVGGKDHCQHNMKEHNFRNVAIDNGRRLGSRHSR